MSSSALAPRASRAARPARRRGIELLRQRDRVADVVAVPVGDEDQVDALRLASRSPGTSGSRSATGRRRSLAARGVEAEGRVAEPGECCSHGGSLEDRPVGGEHRRMTLRLASVAPRPRRRARGRGRRARLRVLRPRRGRPGGRASPLCRRSATCSTARCASRSTVASRCSRRWRSRSSSSATAVRAPLLAKARRRRSASRRSIGCARALRGPGARRRDASLARERSARPSASRLERQAAPPRRARGRSAAARRRTSRP